MVSRNITRRIFSKLLIAGGVAGVAPKLSIEKALGKETEGNMIVTANSDGTAKLWDRKTGKLLADLQGHEHDATGVIVSPRHNWILTRSHDSTLRLWDISGASPGGLIAVLKGHEDLVSGASLSPDGNTIVSWSYDQTIRLWDSKTGKERAVLEGHWGDLDEVVYSPDGTKVMGSSGSFASPVIFDIATGETVHKLTGHTKGIRDAHFSPDGKQIMTASIDKTMRIWDANTGKTVKELEGHEFVGARYSPDGKSILSWGFDRFAALWDVSSGKQIARMDHTAPVAKAIYSPDKKQILTHDRDPAGVGDFKIHLWDAAEGKHIHVFDDHKDTVLGIAFNRDGSRILSRGRGEVRLRNLQDGSALFLSGHRYLVAGAIFSTDEKQILTWGSDGTARVWDADSGEQLLVLESGAFSVHDAAFV